MVGHHEKCEPFGSNLASEKQELSKVCAKRLAVLNLLSPHGPPKRQFCDVGYLD